MLIAHYLFSLLRAWMGGSYPSSGTTASATTSTQSQQPGTVAEPAAPKAQPTTSTATETSQLGLVIEAALGGTPGATVGSQTTPSTTANSAAAATAAVNTAASGTTGNTAAAAQGSGNALGGLSTALGAVGSAQALSVIAAQLAARQGNTSATPALSLDEIDLSALASLATNPDDDAEARALAEDSVLRHRRQDWMARIADAAGQTASGPSGTIDDAAARDAAGAIFAALFGATGSTASLPTTAQTAHRGYGQAFALFG